jgi:hypothetical protein
LQSDCRENDLEKRQIKNGDRNNNLFSCCYRIFKNRETGHQDFQEAMFISMPAAAQWIHIQRLSPRTKRPCLIYHFREITEARNKV